MVPFGSEAMFIALVMIGIGVFMFLLGYWAWDTAREAEEEGRDVELHSVLTDAQTTYRKPWFQKLNALACWVVAVLFIGGGIWYLITL